MNIETGWEKTGNSLVLNTLGNEKPKFSDVRDEKLHDKYTKQVQRLRWPEPGSGESYDGTVNLLKLLYDATTQCSLSRDVRGPMHKFIRTQFPVLSQPPPEHLLSREGYTKLLGLFDPEPGVM